MAWRFGPVIDRFSQHGHAIAEKELSEESSGAPDSLVDFHTGYEPLAVLEDIAARSSEFLANPDPEALLRVRLIAPLHGADLCRNQPVS